VHVDATWVFVQTGSTSKKKQERSKCPECGESIISRPVKKGGWLHTDGGPGLQRVPHRCFNKGKGLSRKRDPDAQDLFEEMGINTTARKPKRK